MGQSGPIGSFMGHNRVRRPKGLGPMAPLGLTNAVAPRQWFAPGPLKAENPRPKTLLDFNIKGQNNGGAGTCPLSLDGSPRCFVWTFFRFLCIYCVFSFDLLFLLLVLIIHVNFRFRSSSLRGGFKGAVASKARWLQMRGGFKGAVASKARWLAWFYSVSAVASRARWLPPSKGYNGPGGFIYLYIYFS